MKISKKLSTVISTALIGVSMMHSSQVLAWGQTGHRVTGKIAESYLSPEAIKQIAILFPHESLAEISTYADEMRSNPSEFWQKKAGPWHYVSVPKGDHYNQVTHAPAEGDAYTAIAAFTKTLKDKAASVEEKRLALHFLVHLIGDLHQPLHAGNGTDHGGNKVKVEFFWQDSNLHRVWDSGIIDRQQLSYNEWARWLGRKISEEQAIKWQSVEPKEWINESIVLRKGLYPKDDKLSWNYQYQYLPVIKKRLQMAGVRIATYLNDIFKSSAKNT